MRSHSITPALYQRTLSNDSSEGLPSPPLTPAKIGEQLTQGPRPINSLNVHEARQVCPHQDDVGTSVLVSPVNAASLPVSPVDVRVQQSEAIGMLHWRQQGAAVCAIEIRSLDPLKEEVEHHPILKTLLLLLALTVASGKQFQ